jgi:CBS domain containing-hemolysin-like protein
MMLAVAAEAVRESIGEAALRGLLGTLTHSLYLFPLLLFAGFFSGTETALMSLGIAQRESLRQSAATDKSSARILWLLHNPRRLITTIIIGNELTNILLSELMTDVVSRLYLLLPAGPLRRLAPSGDGLTALTATLVTVPILVTFGELIPKTIGIKLAERWARAVAQPTIALTWLLWIPRLLVSTVSDVVLFLILGRPARQSESQAPVLDEKHFRSLVDLGSAEGQIQHDEAQLIHNVLDFGDLSVGSVMTPARQVFAVPLDLPLGRVVELVTRQRYSRVPVYRGRRDNLVGLLFTKDLVGYAAGDPHLQGKQLADLLHPPLFVPRRAKCERLFREFQRRKTHLALVVDEYGRLAGLVTMEDLLQSLFGGVVSDPTDTAPSTTTTADPGGSGSRARSGRSDDDGGAHS